MAGLVPAISIIGARAHSIPSLTMSIEIAGTSLAMTSMSASISSERALGEKRANRIVHFQSVDVMRVREGRIADHWGVCNLLCLLHLIGASPIGFRCNMVHLLPGQLSMATSTTCMSSSGAPPCWA